MTPMQHDLFPLWARASLAYERRVPNHRGKRTLRRVLHAVGGRRSRPFVWRMRNGALLAISPEERHEHPATVGWTCYESGEWEPHVERELRALLRPGDVALDVGANLGYFSAVMAQAVGRTGRVVACEPVPETYERLTLCRVLNRFEQLTPLRLALGAENGELELAWDPRLAGNASAYPRPDGGRPHRVTAPLRTLDSLVGAGEVPVPRVIKIDVEGHELAVFQGARETLAAARPALVFELNEPMSRQAGWTAGELAALLRGAAPYRFFLLTPEGRVPVELPAIAAGETGYSDVLALA